MVLGGIAFVLLLGGGCVVSKYNGIVTNQENVEAKWSNIDNQYKRRADLIDNLVNTVKGAANFEKGLLTEHSVNVGEKVRRVAERKCDTVTRLKPAEWRVSIPLLAFACGSPSFQTVL